MQADSIAFEPCGVTGALRLGRAQRFHLSRACTAFRPLQVRTQLPRTRSCRTQGSGDDQAAVRNGRADQGPALSYVLS
jgi:hypothetical protein